MRGDRVIVIGAGLGGLAAGTGLAAEGAEVTMLERAARPGGKLRQIAVGSALIDSGPTVLTMRWVFDELFARAGAALDDHLRLTPAATLARHSWPDGAMLDLYADIDRAADAIGRLSGAGEAEGFRRFTADSRRIYGTLKAPYISGAKPNLPGLIAQVVAANPGNLLRIQPYASLWSRLGKYFRDPRLRQLFARYATYSGSSPFSAPATLMLIAHVEREGVWLVEGGMQMLAEAVVGLATRCGCDIRYGAHVAEIIVTDGRAQGVRLESGEVMEADAVICNGDVNAVAAGMFGQAASGAVEPVPPGSRSLSAMTWSMLAGVSGAPLHRHNLFFSADYAREFDDLFTHGQLPLAPTLYVCAQDRGDSDTAPPQAAERLFCVMNAPATGDRQEFDRKEIEQCTASMIRTLARYGLRIEPRPNAVAVTSPADFHKAFPGTGGALYGRASHGWAASFQRAPARSRIPGLYFAGGSAHPGAGLPMAVLSGRLAALAVTADLALQSRYHRVAMPGGMSTA